MTASTAAAPVRTAAAVDRPRVHTRAIVQAWLLSRGLILLVAVLLSVRTDRSFSQMASGWDVQHFSNLAANGYLGKADGTLMAFFPGLPGLLRTGLLLGIPVVVSGVVLAAIGSAFAAAALARLGGTWAAIAWLFAPTAVFTAVPYTESLFCAFAFWAWVRAREDRWGWAALWAAAACTFRVSGLFLVGALFVMIITARRVGLTERLRRTAWLLLPAGVIVAFVTYLYTLTGSWTAWFHAQSTGWARGLTPPITSFWHTVAAATPGAFPGYDLWPPVFAAEIVSMAVGIVVVGWCLRHRLWAEASWVAIQVVAFSVSYWFFSVNRAVLLWFPLWMMLAQLGGWRPRHDAVRAGWRVVVVGVCVVGVLVMLAWCWLFFTGNWAS